MAEPSAKDGRGGKIKKARSNPSLNANKQKEQLFNRYFFNAKAIGRCCHRAGLAWQLVKEIFV